MDRQAAAQVPVQPPRPVRHPGSGWFAPDAGSEYATVIGAAGEIPRTAVWGSACDVVPIEVMVYGEMLL